MFEHCLIAEYEDASKAGLGLEVLIKADVPEERISFVSRSDAPELQQLKGIDYEVHQTEKGSGLFSAGVGALLGGAAVVPIAVSTLVVPLFVVGPLLGAGIGAALAGAMREEELGLPQSTLETYASRVQSGNALVIVTGDKYDLREAKELLQTTGPTTLQEIGGEA